jgi:hypothetical protein
MSRLSKNMWLGVVLRQGNAGLVGVPRARRPCRAAGALAYYVLSRRVGRLPLCENPTDYAAS